MSAMILLQTLIVGMGRQWHGPLLDQEMADAGLQEHDAPGSGEWRSLCTEVV